MSSLSELNDRQGQKPGPTSRSVCSLSSQRRSQYLIGLWPGRVDEPRAASERGQGFYQLAALARRSDCLSERDKHTWRSEKFSSHRCSQGPYPTRGAKKGAHDLF